MLLKKTEMAEETENKKELLNFLPALLVIIMTAIVVGGAVFFWQNQSFKKAKEELRQELVRQQAPALTQGATLTLSLTPTSTAASTPALTAPVPTVTPTPTDKYAGWLTYINDVYDYQFKYPSGASIEEAAKEAFSLSPDEVSSGMTFEDKYSKYTGKVCISLSYKLGYVQISAPVNRGFAHVICGRTGRAYEGSSGSETLTIDGRIYTASGFEEQGPGETLDVHNETMVVTLDDGTRIEYGSRPDEIATYADYLLMREEIIKIVESYRKI